MRLRLATIPMTQPQGASAQQIRERDARRRKARDAELALTRGRATSWAKGIGALLAAGLAFSLIKGRSDLTGLGPVFAAGVGAALLVALVLAAVSAYFLFRAAYGRLEAIPPETTDHTLAVQTMKDLRVGLVLAAVGTAVLIAGVGLTWYGPAADGPLLQAVDGTGTSWCGEPSRTVDGRLTLKTGGQEVVIDLTKVSQIRAVTACPKP